MYSMLAYETDIDFPKQQGQDKTQNKVDSATTSQREILKKSKGASVRKQSRLNPTKSRSTEYSVRKNEMNLNTRNKKTGECTKLIVLQ